VLRQQVVRSNRQPRLTVKLIPRQKKRYVRASPIVFMLPDTLLTCHIYTQSISLYRQLLTEVIMDEGRDSQVAEGRVTHEEILQGGFHGQCFPNIKFR